MSSKHIKEFNNTGICVLDLDYVCKTWKDKFLITTWKVDHNTTKYQFIIQARGKAGTKAEISPAQAQEIIDRLELVHVENAVFKSGGSYHTREFIKAERKRFIELKEQKLNEIDVIESQISKLGKCILKNF